MTIDVNQYGWGHCLACNEYLSPQRVKHHALKDGSCRKPRRYKAPPFNEDQIYDPGDFYDEVSL